jgi:hypothetical protein
MNYDFGNKRNWRRWVWNRISERVADKRNARVLFLAGDDPVDIRVATEKGFRAANMIAVERDSKVVAELKKSGVLVIEADLLEMLKHWSPSQRVDVVVADFMCNFRVDVFDGLWRALLNPAFADVVMAVNMQRGREAGDHWKAVKLFMENTSDKVDDKKHRGRLFFTAMLWSFVIGPLGERSREQKRDAIPVLCSWANPSFNSYRNDGALVTMDSVVWRNIWGQALRDGGLEPGWCGGLRGEEYKGSRLRRKAAAVLAHSTMRA